MVSSKFKIKSNVTEIHNRVSDRCSVIKNQRITFCKWPFFISKHVFNNLKLKISLAIPAVNDEKWRQTIQENMIRYSLTASLPPCNLCVVLPVNNSKSWKCHTKLLVCGEETQLQIQCSLFIHSTKLLRFVYFVLKLSYSDLFVQPRWSRGRSGVMKQICSLLWLTISL